MFCVHPHNARHRTQLSCRVHTAWTTDCQAPASLGIPRTFINFLRRNPHKDTLPRVYTNGKRWNVGLRRNFNVAHRPFTRGSIAVGISCHTRQFHETTLGKTVVTKTWKSNNISVTKTLQNDLLTNCSKTTWLDILIAECVFWFKQRPQVVKHSTVVSCCFQHISAILDFRGPIMGSSKSPYTTSYMSSIETIAVNC